MKTLQKLFLFLLLTGISHGLTAQEAVKEAETAYAQENYAQAIELYESVLKNFGDSYEIYYNLGNAYYKTGKIASAILNYERALLIHPGDKEVRFNLDIARLRTIDKIEPLGELFLTKWIRAAQNLFGVDTWAGISIICFILFIACLTLFFFAKWMRLRKMGFYLGIGLLFIVICANLFAWEQKKALVERNDAIIFASTVTIKSSPDASGKELFLLHEGVKVHIKSSIGEWNEIELEDGSIGWIHRKDIEKI